MKIAILGTRGIPANYGGFETFADELSRELVNRGHQVAVYGRRNFFKVQEPQIINGVVSIKTPTIYSKYLETPLHAFTSFIDVVRHQSFDVLLLCNAANSPMAWILALFNKAPIIINVDGIERKRKKWGFLGKIGYRLGEFCSVKFSDRIVSDANCIQEYYRERYGIESDVIRYGARAPFVGIGAVHKKFNLTAGEYFLYVSRLEPENNALGVVQAYVKSGVTRPLVVVGDAPYADDYKAQLRAAANDRVIFTGFQFGDAYRELRSNCFAYIQATEVGGTHPALVEAMAHGNYIIANDVPEHRETLHDCGEYYAKNDFVMLSEVFKRVAGMSAADRRVMQDKAVAFAQAQYSWSAITDQYEALFKRVLNK